MSQFTLFWAFFFPSSSFPLARSVSLHNFLSFILSGFHFVIFFLLLSPGCSLPLPPSLPPSVSTYLSFSFFLLLSFDCCLTLTLSLFHSALPPSLSLSSLSLSLCLPPPLLLISPSLSLYLSFSLFSFFSPLPLPSTRLCSKLSPSLSLCLCFFLFPPSVLSLLSSVFVSSPAFPFFFFYFLILLSFFLLFFSPLLHLNVCVFVCRSVGHLIPHNTHTGHTWLARWIRMESFIVPVSQSLDLKICLRTVLIQDDFLSQKNWFVMRLVSVGGNVLCFFFCISFVVMQ